MKINTATLLQDGRVLIAGARSTPKNWTVSIWITWTAWIWIPWTPHL